MEAKRKLQLYSLISLAFSLLIWDPQFLIVSIFLFAYSHFMGKPWMNRMEIQSKEGFANFLVISFASGILMEFLAILSNLGLPPSDRKLFLPDPVLDLIVSVGYYLPLAVAITLFAFKYDISVKEAFIGGGVYGVLTEQSGFIFLSFNLVFWVYVFLVYGSFIALPFTVFNSGTEKDESGYINQLKLITSFTVWLLVAFFILIQPSMFIVFLLLGIQV